MYEICDAKNLNEANMLWLLGHDDSDVDNVETNLADSDDNEDYLSEQDEIPDKIFQEENDTISQNNEGVNPRLTRVNTVIKNDTEEFTPVQNQKKSRARGLCRKVALRLKDHLPKLHTHSTLLAQTYF
ncbi:hypothetical protein FQA39_LY12705 [Lamprigera yunnana]|nr:hypothetical protein FQA39_LY12705 [Lamprigera yunnana]